MKNRGGCLFCGDPLPGRDHFATCDGRQGQIESAINAILVAPGVVDAAVIGLETPIKVSRAAYASLTTHDRQRCAARIAAVLSSCPTTCDDVEIATGMSHQTTSATINALVKQGRVVDSGKRARTRTGRFAVIWQLRAAS